MWEAQLKDVFWNLVKIIAPAPIAGYFIVYFSDELKKAWKSNNKRKKWIVASCAFGMVVVFLNYLHRMVF
jgi:hypothetical protein